MDCPLKTGKKNVEASEVLVAYCAQALPPVAKAAFEAHLDTCAECRRVTAAQTQVWSVLDAWSPAAIPSNFDERLFARIAVEQVQPWWTRALQAVSDRKLNWSWKPAMPIAAACAALLAAFLFKSPLPEHQPVASVQTRVDIEQVERAFDDMDMLQQLGLTSQATTATPIRPKNL